MSPHDAFDMPVPPDGYKWKVTHRGYMDREFPHIKPLNVFLVDRRGYASYRRSWEPMAVAWNSPASVRRAAEKVLRRHNRNQRREAEKQRREESRPESAVLRDKAKRQSRDSKAAAREAAVQERFGALLGEYPPKRLGERH